LLLILAADSFLLKKTDTLVRKKSYAAGYPKSLFKQTIVLILIKNY